MYYKICECCGAHLDLGERCDCRSDIQKPDKIPDDPVTLTLKSDGMWHIHVWGDCFDYVAATRTLATLMKETLMKKFKDKENNHG